MFKKLVVFCCHFWRDFPKHEVLWGKSCFSSDEWYIQTFYVVKTFWLFSFGTSAKCMYLFLTHKSLDWKLHHKVKNRLQDNKPTEDNSKAEIIGNYLPAFYDMNLKPINWNKEQICLEDSFSVQLNPDSTSFLIFISLSSTS